MEDVARAGVVAVSLRLAGAALVCADSRPAFDPVFAVGVLARGVEVDVLGVLGRAGGCEDLEDDLFWA